MTQHLSFIHYQQLPTLCSVCLFLVCSVFHEDTMIITTLGFPDWLRWFTEVWRLELFKDNLYSSKSVQKGLLEIISPSFSLITFPYRFQTQRDSIFSFPIDKQLGFESWESRLAAFIALVTFFLWSQLLCNFLSSKFASVLGDVIEVTLLHFPKFLQSMAREN